MNENLLRLLAAAAGAAVAEAAYRQTSGTMGASVEKMVSASADQVERVAGRVLERAVERIGDHVEGVVASFFGMSGSTPPPKGRGTSWVDEDVIDVEFTHAR
jgi:hypothetical protein